MEKIKLLLKEQRLNFAVVGCIACAIALIVGIYACVTYSVPMQRSQYLEASDSLMANQSISLYDLALQQYKEEQYKQVIETTEAAYNACIRDGMVDPDRVKLAADIKFLAGNAMVKAKQLKAAVDAYKQALRLDPKNLEAKYNLEFLQQMNGGAGPGGGDPKDPNSGQGGGKKKSI